MLHHITRNPNFRVLRKELDEYEDGNSWPTTLNIALHRTLVYKDVTLGLDINLEAAVSAFNGVNPITTDIFTAEREVISSVPVGTNWVSLRFPSLHIPVKRTRSKYNYTLYKYVREPYYEEVHAAFSLAFSFNQEKFQADMEGKYKEYKLGEQQKVSGIKLRAALMTAQQKEQDERLAAQKAAKKAADLVERARMKNIETARAEANAAVAAATV